MSAAILEHQNLVHTFHTNITMDNQTNERKEKGFLATAGVKILVVILFFSLVIGTFFVSDSVGGSPRSGEATNVQMEQVRRRNGVPRMKRTRNITTACVNLAGWVDFYEDSCDCETLAATRLMCFVHFSLTVMPF